MVVDRFCSSDELAIAHDAWTELYGADPDANLFVSWDWMSACLAAEARRWLILGVRDDSGRYVAFLPLRFDRFPRSGPVLCRQLWLGISPRADFTGMIGAVGDEERFIPALAREIEKLPWDTFLLNNCADRRIAALAQAFVPSRYRLVPTVATPCPYVQLPDSWEKYLGDRGTSTRRTIRSRLRKIESLPGYRLHFPTLDEADDAIEDLLKIHSARWRKNLKIWRRHFVELLSRCYASGRLGIAAMYDGDTLMAAQGFFIEPTRRTIVGYMIGYNPKYSKLSPGMMLGCASVRRAIEEGYAVYNFSQGDQPYKISLASGVEYISNATVWRRSIRATIVRTGIATLNAAKRLARRVVDSPLVRWHAGSQRKSSTDDSVVGAEAKALRNEAT
jgi:CelD/BcsL family acetyltransferase involved in cellulose biosynthesis